MLHFRGSHETQYMFGTSVAHFRQSTKATIKRVDCGTTNTVDEMGIRYSIVYLYDRLLSG